MKPDLNSWIERLEVARRLGIEPRTVTDLITRRVLRPVKFKRHGKGGAAVNLFDPAEVESVRQQRAAAAAKPQVLAAALTMPALPQISDLAKAADLVRLADRAGIELDSLTDREVVTLDEAARISGYGRGTLEALIAAGNLAAKRVGRRGSVVIRRADLARVWELLP